MLRRNRISPLVKTVLDGETVVTHAPKFSRLFSICCLVWLVTCGAAAMFAEERPAGVEKALRDLQHRVNQDRKLRGVFLKDAYFNQRGELVVQGFRPRCEKQLFEEQTKCLEELIVDYGKTEWPAIRQAPRIDLDQLECVTNLLDQLQQEAANHPKLRDVMFWAQKYDNGHLRLEVIQGGHHSEEELEQFVGGVLARSPDWPVIAANLTTVRPDEPVAWSVRILETFSFREFVREIQAEIARRPGLDGTRVDNAFFNALGRLTLEGIRPSTPRTPAGQAGAEDHVARQLDKVLVAKISSRGEKWADFLPADFGGLRPVESPLPYLRQVVTESAEFDGIRIDRAYYDGEGTLCLLGIRNSASPGTPCQAALLKRVVTQKFSSHPNWSEWKGDTLSTAGLREVDFEAIRSSLHRALNRPRESDGRRLDRVRIDRIWYDIDNKLRLRGVCWNECGDADQGNAIREAIREELKLWPGILEGNSDSPDIAEVTPIESVLSTARQILARHPEMDGVRIENAYYDQEGRLHFYGTQARKDQGTQASSLLQAEADGEQWQRAVARGWTIDHLRPLPFSWDGLVRSLREGIAQRATLDGTRIDRVYYDKDLKLTLEGQRWGDARPLEEVIVSTLRGEFRDAARNIDGTAIVGDRGVPTESLLARIDLSQVRLVENPLRHLRKLVSQDCSYDGIRVDRIYYDQENRLHCAGLLDNPSQGHLLQELWAGFSKDPRWAEQAAQELRVDSMRCLPIGPLLQFVKEILPVYEELDGASVVRAFHAPDGRLAFEGRVLSREQAQVLGDRMARELEQRPSWALRLASFSDLPPIAKPSEKIDVSGMTITPVKPDLFEAQRVVNLAWDLYLQERYPEAIQQLDLAMAYYPRYGPTWYVRALCYIAIDRRDLARRDLRRAVDMENRFIIPKNLHYHVLQRIQGPRRITFEWLRTEALLQKQDGTVIRNLCAGDEPRPEVRISGVSIPLADLMPPVFSPGEAIQRKGVRGCGR